MSAHTTFTTPGGVVLTRTTDGVGANRGPAVKTWVNARISIAPNATNEVGQPHTFTVTLEKDPATAPASCRPPVRHVQRHPDQQQRRGAQRPAGSVQRWHDQRRRPVHRHLHLADCRHR